MDKSLANHCTYEFGAFTLDASQCVLRRGVETVALTPKAFETLLVLVRNGGRIVQKQELLSAVWPDTFVEESNLTFNISVLRKTLNEGDEPGGGIRYIETVSKRGYRFVAPVREIHDGAATLAGNTNTIEINGNGEATGNSKIPFSDSARSIDKDELYEPQVSSGVEHEGESAALIPRSAVEPASRNLESSAVSAMTTQAAARGRMRPRWLLAVVPLCLLLLLAGVGAWQLRQGNRGRSESTATLSNAQEFLSPQSKARALYLKGRYLWNTRSDRGLIKSEEYYKRALDAEPNFALAYSGLADVYAFDPYDSPRWREGERLAQKAIALDASLAEPHASLGFIQMFHHWDFAAAENEFKTAIRLDPDYATAHHWYAVLLECEERFPEAKAEIHKALERDPLSLPINADVAEIYYFARDYSKARDYIQAALELNNELVQAKSLRDRISAQLGVFGSDDGANVAASCAEISPVATRAIRDAYLSAGCSQILSKQLIILQNGDINRSALGQAQNYASLGDKEQALAWLERAYQTHSFSMPFLKVTPAFDALRNDARYQDILRRMKFSENQLATN